MIARGAVLLLVAEAVADEGRELEPIPLGAVAKALAEVLGLAPHHGVLRQLVGRPTTCGDGVALEVGVAERGAAVEPLVARHEACRIARLSLTAVVEASSGLEALARLLGDEVHHPPYSIGAIEGGGSPTDDLDALDSSHVDAIEVYHPVPLGGDLLPVDEEEYVVPRHALD